MDTRDISDIPALCDVFVSIGGNPQGHPADELVLLTAPPSERVQADSRGNAGASFVSQDRSDRGAPDHSAPCCAPTAPQDDHPVIRTTALLGTALTGVDRGACDGVHVDGQAPMACDPQIISCHPSGCSHPWARIQGACTPCDGHPTSGRYTTRSKPPTRHGPHWSLIPRGTIFQ